MKVIMLMFDSLNRHLLSSYGCEWVHSPNFLRLSARAATFDQSWVCSLPCMPARRDFHSGRPNFLHTPWSPLQPWDDSVPEMLGTAGIATHLATDHYHYLEDGGASFHPRYTTWEVFRGQEGDPWIGQVAEPIIPANRNGKGRRQDWVNRQFLQSEADFPQTRTVRAGLDFIARNHSEDQWFLHIENFDPHEPFVSAERYQRIYERAGEVPLFDWPAYADVTETPEEIEQLRHNYAALVSQCDANLGLVLDAMDQYDLWKDTMLIVWTDHGFLLGEHGRWAKNLPTVWNEIARTPFFIWDPRSPEAAGARRSALVQPAIDLGPTLLRFFGIEPTAEMTGRDLAPVIQGDAPIRRDAMFGYFGQPLHYTDGRWVYLRDVVDATQPFHEYNSMPVHIRSRWQAKDWQGAELHPPLPFTKGMPVIRRPSRMSGRFLNEHLLFDLQNDPGQLQPIHNPSQEAEIVERMKHWMAECHAPAEQLARYGLQAC